MSRPVLVCVNPASGGCERDGDDLAAIGDALRAAGVDSTVELVEGADLPDRVRAEVDSGAGLVVVAGGDGSVSAAASVLAGADTTLGILPMGTLNHFARDLGLPADLAEAAAVIGGGRIARVDVASVNDRTFINNSAIGLYPLMVLDRDLQRRRLGRRKGLALAVAAARTLWRFGRQRLQLTAGSGQAQLDTPLLFVGNNDYRLDLPAAGTRDSLSDGKLCVMVMRSKSRRGFLAATLRALAGRTRTDDMVRLDPIDRLRVASRRHTLAVSLDGEVVAMKPPLDYRIRASALKVIAP